MKDFYIHIPGGFDKYNYKVRPYFITFSNTVHGNWRALHGRCCSVSRAINVRAAEQ